MKGLKKGEGIWELSLLFKEKDSAIKYLAMAESSYSKDDLTGLSIFRMFDGDYIVVMVFSAEMDFKAILKDSKNHGAEPFNPKVDVHELKDYAAWGIVGDAGILVR